MTAVSWCSQFSTQQYVRRTVYICRTLLFLLRVVLNTKLSVEQLNTKFKFLPPREQTPCPLQTIFDILHEKKFVDCFTFGRSSVLIPNHRPRTMTEILLIINRVLPNNC
jgi:hypothetical protein